MKHAARLALFLGVAALMSACQSGSSSSSQSPQSAQQLSPDQAVESIKKILAKSFPGMDVQSVKTVQGFPGIYEVQVDDDIVYMDPTAKYALVGQLVDLKSRVNLTEKAMQKQAEQAWKKLPLQHAIKEVRGNGKRTLVLFSDPDCPFCKKIERTIQELDNVTIYTFLTPIPELHPDAARKSKAIWCAEDHLKAWIGFMRKGEPLPEVGPLCSVPQDDWAKLQKRFKIRATPTLLFSNGKVVPGALEKDGIEKIFDQIDNKDANKDKEKAKKAE